MKRIEVCAAFAALVFTSAVASSPAPSSDALAQGVAFDVVSYNDESSQAPVPREFDADFAAASVPIGTRTPATSRAATSLGPTALRFYFGKTKFRADIASFGYATLTDCIARTTTTLNLVSKTYDVRPIVAPPSRVAASSPAPRAISSPLLQSVRETTRKLDPVMIDGVSAIGYLRSMSLVSTNAPSSQPRSVDTVEYFSSAPHPIAPCTDISNVGFTFGETLTQYGAVTSAFSPNIGAGTNVYTSIVSTGPTIPRGLLPIWSYEIYRMPDGRTRYEHVERVGHVRPITDDDDVFRVPPDFTRASPPPSR